MKERVRKKHFKRYNKHRLGAMLVLADKDFFLKAHSKVEIDFAITYASLIVFAIANIIKLCYNCQQ